ncbi:hypothetical protein [Halostagnicola kamekurae]|uniref:hypothetical protein n=1 Tax=Halostagnicola kamekurae TaxID=619731 RepID=UPI000B847599|nr:hypothetical protein [Halostagnicola kamekurae]
MNEDQTPTTIGLTPRTRVEAIDRLARHSLARAEHDDLEDDTATRLREQALEIRAEVEITREILSNGDGMEVWRRNDDDARTVALAAVVRSPKSSPLIKILLNRKIPREIASSY